VRVCQFRHSRVTDRDYHSATLPKMDGASEPATPVRDSEHTFAGGFLVTRGLAVIGFAATVWVARSGPLLRRT